MQLQDDGEILVIIMLYEGMAKYMNEGLDEITMLQHIIYGIIKVQYE